MNTSTFTVKPYIDEIHFALMFNTGCDVLRLPNQLVHTIRTDEQGQIWVLVPRPKQQIEQFDPHFPARLNYYRKGAPVAVQVEGKATIITDPEMINSVCEEIRELPGNLNAYVLIHVQAHACSALNLQPAPPMIHIRIMEWFKSVLQYLFGSERPGYAGVPQV